MTDEGLTSAEVEIMLLNINRNNEAIGHLVDRIANDQMQVLEPILQDIINRQALALSGLL